MVERPQTAELQATTIKLDHRVRDCDEATRRLAPASANQSNQLYQDFSILEGWYRDIVNEDKMGNSF